MAGCPRLPRRETERERGRSVKFIVINRSWLDKRGSKLEEEAGTKEEEKSGATEGRETRAYRYSSPSLPTDNKFPTKVSRFDVDKVVAPTRCPRAFASLSKFLRRALVHIYIYISSSPPSPRFSISLVPRGKDSRFLRNRAVTRCKEGSRKCVFSRFRRETTCENFGILCMAFRCRSMPTPSVPSYAEE